MLFKFDQLYTSQLAITRMSNYFKFKLLSLSIYTHSDMPSPHKEIWKNTIMEHSLIMASFLLFILISMLQFQLGVSLSSNTKPNEGNKTPFFFQHHLIMVASLHCSLYLWAWSLMNMLPCQPNWDVSTYLLISLIEWIFF